MILNLDDAYAQFMSYASSIPKYYEEEGNNMRVVWKDSSSRVVRKQPRMYRGIKVKGAPRGWTVDIPGDDNIYRTYPCAQNAVDKVLGGHGSTGTANLRKQDIQILVNGEWVTIE